MAGQQIWVGGGGGFVGNLPMFLSVNDGETVDDREDFWDSEDYPDEDERSNTLLLRKQKPR